MSYFSIIIATKNPTNDLINTIQSIKKQKFIDYEIIIVDSDSKYDWNEFFGIHLKDINILLSEKDSGIYDAWNKGINLASGNWIIFLGEGDIFHNENVLENYNKKCDENNNINYAYGDIIIQGKNTTIKKPWHKYQHKLRSEMPVPHVGMAHNHKLFKKNQRFNTNFRISGDYEFFIRTATKTNVLYIDNFTTTIMKPGGISSDPKFSIKIVIENYKANMLNGHYAPSLAFITNSIRYLLRYCKFYVIKFLRRIQI